MKSLTAVAQPAPGAEHLPAEPVSPLVAATAHALPAQDDVLAKARSFALPLIAEETLDTGENALLQQAPGTLLVLPVGAACPQVPA